MNIRFTSSLTAQDENTLAPVLLEAVTSLLASLPIAYMIRIDTSDSQVYRSVRSQEQAPPVDDTIAS